MEINKLVLRQRCMRLMFIKKKGGGDLSVVGQSVVVQTVLQEAS